MIISMSVLYFFELRLCAALKVFLMSDVLVYGFPSFTLGVPTAHYASCTINHAKIKIFGDYYIVIPICINYFKNRTKTWSFVHPEPHSYPIPSTFRAVSVDGTTHQPPPVHVLPPFVDGKFFGAGLTMAVVDNCLCIRELLNILAANGEQGERGSD